MNNLFESDKTFLCRLYLFSQKRFFIVKLIVAFFLFGLVADVSDENGFYWGLFRLPLISRSNFFTINGCLIIKQKPG